MKSFTELPSDAIPALSSVSDHAVGFSRELFVPQMQPVRVERQPTQQQANQKTDRAVINTSYQDEDCRYWQRGGLNE